MDNSFEQYGIKPSKINRQKRRDKRLHEEVIECGRYRGGRRNKKSRGTGLRKRKQQLDRLDAFPQHESIRMSGKINSYTGLSDNLEPLERWLASQVGRPWTQVYSELGKIINPGSMHGMHIRDHLWHYVQPKTWLDENGEVVVPGRFGNIRGPNTKFQTFAPDYFVHPVTGIFQKMPEGTAQNKGPYPKKARWKKEKQRIRAKIRQGIAHKPAAEAPGADISAWPCIRTRIKRLQAGCRLDIRQGSDVFRAEIQEIKVGQGRSRRVIEGRSNWGFHHVLALKVFVLEVCAGEKIGLSQELPLFAYKGETPEWTAFDEGRLF